jgi:Cd2+/Zn2+-exporting ATPase
MDGERGVQICRAGAGAVCYGMALASVFPAWNWLFYLAAYLFFGVDVLLKAGKNILQGELFDENFLMSVSSLGAFLIHQYAEAAAVMIFYQVGEFFQDLAIDQSRNSIHALMQMRPEEANVARNGRYIRKKTAEIAPGEILLVKPGEKIPLDGEILEGHSQLDLSSLLGEPAPRSVSEGDTVLSGSINLLGALKMRVTKTERESTAAKIMDLVEKALAKKAPAENFIGKFAKFYTPLVVISAAVIAFIPPLFTDIGFSVWLSRALIFLAVSCPCALVASIPLCFFSGIGVCSHKGILVKGGGYLQKLAEINTVVLDKTGTLTKGVFRVTRVAPASESTSSYSLFEKAYLAEKNSVHPAAKAIVSAFEEQYGENLAAARQKVSGFKEISGMGVEAMVSGQKIAVGRDKWMARHGISAPAADGFGTVAHVACQGRYLGHFVISDEIKKDGALAIASLKKMGLRRIVMLTGDNAQSAQKTGAQLGIESIYSQLLPHEKLERLDKIYARRHNAKILFAGDGINDAPVLARADVGVAMGAGTDAAMEAADVIIMTSEPSKIAEAIQIARNTMKIIRQNIVFILIAKLLILALAAMGHATMWLAVFADVGVEAAAILNALREK